MELLLVMEIPWFRQLFSLRRPWGGMAGATPALTPVMFSPRAAHTGPAEALFHSLQQYVLLLRAEIPFDFQEKTGGLLFQGVLEVIDGGNLGRDFSLVGLRLFDEVIEPLALLVQLLPQGLNLLPVQREALF